MRTALLFALLVAVAGCSTPPTITDQQTEVLREMKLYLKAKNWDPERVKYTFDEFNDAWMAYWGDPTLEMTPEAKKWHDQRHAIWIYQIVPEEGVQPDVHVLWIFVDRKSKAILGDLVVK